MSGKATAHRLTTASQHPLTANSWQHPLRTRASVPHSGSLQPNLSGRQWERPDGLREQGGTPL
eukprot:354827-Chlamydomonas_euryale.AAC.5